MREGGFGVKILKVLLLVLLLGTVSAFAQTTPTQMVNETPSQWFVELASAPLADVDATFTTKQKADYRGKLKAEKDAFRTAARAAGVQFKERRAFDVLWNGLAIEIDPSQLSALGRVPGVANLYPIVTISIPELQPMEQPDLATALAMTGADVAQSELGLTGAGIKVAVMDTGIDYNHPDLGGCFGPSCRVFTGFDFVGDNFNAGGTGSALIPVPDLDPDDCNGHGTHVAGIVGANGTVKGVAPEVRFGAYRVFGCVGSTFADIMIEAMERILADGMQVLNMSIGAAFQWPQYPTAQASDRLVNKGVSVVASIGNSGPPVYSAGAPGVGSKVIGVASFDNTHLHDLRLFTISPDDTAIGYLAAAAAPAPPTSGSDPMARTGTPVSAEDACTALPAGSLAGKVALIRRGACTFYTKARNAELAGAVGVVLYNNLPGFFSATVARPSPTAPTVTKPVVSTSDALGVLINNRLAAGPVTMTWTAESGTFANPTDGTLSSFSSGGHAPDLTLKPDIGAPGGFIRSTLPVEQGSYGTLSGTSMSSPHVAGGVALLLQARPDTPAQVVRSILQNSADPRPRLGTPAGLDSAHRQGAGMLQIDKAIEATAKIEPGKLSLGESAGGPATRTLTIENNSAFTATYTFSHAPALSTTGSTFSPGFTTGSATVTFSTPSITILGKSKGTVDVTITANPALADKSQYGGYVVFTPVGGGQVYRVPYAGFKGDYQAILVLNPAASNFGNPLLRSSLTTFGPSGPITINPGTGQVAYVLFHLDQQVRYIRLEVFEAATGRAYGRVFQQNYVGRNSTAMSFFVLTWDGKDRRGVPVPNGTYVLRFSLLKALGTDADPSHIESWTSPPITVTSGP